MSQESHFSNASRSLDLQLAARLLYSQLPAAQPNKFGKSSVQWKCEKLFTSWTLCRVNFTRRTVFASHSSSGKLIANALIHPICSCTGFCGFLNWFLLVLALSSNLNLQGCQLFRPKLCAFALIKWRTKVSLHRRAAVLAQNNFFFYIWN